MAGRLSGRYGADDIFVFGLDSVPLRTVGGALGPKGTLYVADGYNDRIQAFSLDGRFLGKWGGPFAANIWGPFWGWFATVTGLAVDGAGNVFAANSYNHRVQKFSPDGAFLTAFGDKD